MKLDILCLHNKKLFDKNIDRNFFHGYAAISKHNFVERFVYSGVGWGNYNSSLSVNDNISNIYRNGKKPNFIIVFQPQLYKEINKVDIFKCCRADEVYSKHCEDGFIRHNINLVIFHHQNDMIRLSRRADFRGIYVENIPRLVETSIFRNFGEKKVHDLLLIGHMSKVTYPFRCRLGEIIKSRLFDKYAKSVVKHPGYEISSPMSVQTNFSREINKAKIVLTCSSKYKYALSKYVEVPASYALLAADLPDERHVFYSSYMLVLDSKDSDATICAGLLYWLSHDTEREILIKKGYDLVTKERSATKYADSFVNVVKKYF